MKLNKNDDLIVIIDMINGFAFEGNFASENVAAMIPEMSIFIKEALQDGVEVIHYTDSHPKNAQEFKTYPVHCIENTKEALPVDALDFDGIEIIYKNSTNGFFSKNPFDYKKNIYIVGCVTDICVFEFALSAQKYKENFNLNENVNVIKKFVTTFDAPNHDANEVNEEYLNLLQSRGIKIVV
ncbi:MAG: isochorismatase family cysteine hydrolase [Erysipelotrichales bacterium]